MSKKIVKISAIGTKGEAKGKIFTAQRDTTGKYVLNKKTFSPENGSTTNRAENKVYVKDLNEAINLLATNDYLINLVSTDGKRALREFNKVIIEYA